MIFNPCIAGGGKIKNMIINPDYINVQFKKISSSPAKNAAVITYDAEKQKNTFLTISAPLGNVPHDTFAITLLPSEQKVFAQCTYAAALADFQMTKDSDTQFTLTIQSVFGDNVFGQDSIVTVYEM